MVLLTPFSVLKCPDTVSCLSISNNILALGFENGIIHLLPLDDCTSPLVLTPSSEPCTALSFAGSDSNTFYSSYGGNIVSWDLRNLKTSTSVWKISEDEINSLDVNDQASLIAAADDIGNVSLISLMSGTIVCLLKRHENICSVVKFRPNYLDQLISAGLDCRLIVGDWKSRDHRDVVFEMATLIDSHRYGSLFSGACGANENVNEKPVIYGECMGDEASIRIASSFTPEEAEQLAATCALSKGLAFNPPMIHSLVSSDSGEYVAAGLGNGMVEVFHGENLLRHVESLLGHKRSVAALLPISESHLLSGGDDCCLFLWKLPRGGSGQRFEHSAKISALAGRELTRIYVADNTSSVKLVDLVRS